MKNVCQLAAMLLSAAVPLGSYAQGPTALGLLNEPSSVAKGAEIIMSRVEIPAHTQLTKHWHHGEEYAYILSGSVTLWRAGEPPLLMKAGDAIKIPRQQIHNAITADESVSIMVFRVHETGKPVRVDVVD